MRRVNIGIVAHIDAGKTSLTERILFETNVIDEIGRVDEGNTQTDSLDLEKRRGITIKASVVSFFVQDLKINLIDTPGHADFIAEVERSFSVLDGAILVISAVEGVQAQTKFLMTLLMKLGIPTIIFVNKIDRRGAQSHTLVTHIKEKLTESVIPFYTPENLGTKQAFIVEKSLDKDPTFLEECIDLVTLNDETLLATYVNEEKLTEEQVKIALTSQVRDAKLYPIFFGSAMTGAGEFCKVWGLKDVRIGDVVGEWSHRIKDLHFVAPQMEARIEPKNPEQSNQLYRALVELSEEDPLLKVIKDTFHHEIYLRIFGEVQKEVIESMLQENYGLAVQFSETRVVCVEKPAGIGQAVEEIGAAENLFAATVGFRVEPGAPDSGVSYTLEVKLGSLPLAFHRAIEETVYETLKQGLYGWEVTDIAVFLTHTGYFSPVTAAGDFRKLVPLVLMEALSRAGTAVYEPLNQFELSAPARSSSNAMFRLSALRAVLEKPVLLRETFLLTGMLPVATTEEFKRSLQSFTEGEGVFLTKPSGFCKIEGTFPTRKRADYNPLNRKDYMLHILHAY